MGVRVTRAAETPNHPGVCFSGLGRRAIGQIIDMLVLLYEVYAAEDMAGRIEYL